MGPIKLSFDGHGLNDKTNEYCPRVATFSNEYKGNKELGHTLAAAPELLAACEAALDRLHHKEHEIVIDQCIAAINKAKGL